MFEIILPIILGGTIVIMVVIIFWLYRYARPLLKAKRTGILAVHFRADGAVRLVPAWVEGKGEGAWIIKLEDGKKVVSSEISGEDLKKYFVPYFRQNFRVMVVKDGSLKPVNIYDEKLMDISEITYHLMREKDRIKLMAEYGLIPKPKADIRGGFLKVLPILLIILLGLVALAILGPMFGLGK